MKKFVSGIFIFVAAIILRQFLPSLLDLFSWQFSDSDKQILDKVLDVIVWVAGTLLVCLMVRVLVWGTIVKNTTNRNTPELIKQLLDCLIILISVIIASKVLFGQNVLAAVTALSALGIVISFGIKDLIQDLMTGLAVNLEVSFSLGDWVSVQDGQVGRIFGQVVQINWRTTHIMDDAKRYYIVPNREIGNSTITVFSNPTSLTRDEVKVEVDYNIPVNDAKQILMTAVMSVLDEYGFSERPQPEILVSRFPANGIEYTIRFWIYAWEQITPSIAQDIIFTSVMRQLRVNALSPSFTKLEYFDVDPPDLLKPPELASNSPQFISNIGFFEPMTSEEVDLIAESGKIRNWSCGQEILKQGDEGQSMFVMLGGLVKVYISTKNEQETYVGKILPGEVFGEMSLLAGEPRTATVKAVTTVTTLEITQDIVEKLLSNRPVLGEKLSEIVALRQQKSADAVAQNGQAQTLTLKKSIYGKMRKLFKLP